MHFFKDKENKFHYFCSTCVLSDQMTNKYSVDLMWAIKWPIKNLESKPWPELDSEALLDSESKGSV
jgi:hypothetical protein